MWADRRVCRQSRSRCDGALCPTGGRRGRADGRAETVRIAQLMWLSWESGYRIKPVTLCSETPSITFYCMPNRLVVVCQTLSDPLEKQLQRPKHTQRVMRVSASQRLRVPLIALIVHACSLLLQMQTITAKITNTPSQQMVATIDKSHTHTQEKTLKANTMTTSEKKEAPIIPTKISTRNYLRRGGSTTR